MAIREYIGARYVPKFYDDGHGGAEWTPDVEYEPLTVVLYNGNSYTSRQFVPIGAEITNTKYWLETGNWNSQVEQYRQEVLTFDGRITENENAIASEVIAREQADSTLEGQIGAEAQAREQADSALAGQIESEATARTRADTALAGQINALSDRIDQFSADVKNVVLIGDSWVINSANLVSKVRGTGAFENVYSKAESGCGFSAGGNQTGKNVTQLLSDLAGSQTAEIRNSIDRVVVVCGVNDRSFSQATLLNAIGQFCEQAASSYPKAKVMIAGCNLKNFYEGARIGSNTVLRAYTRCGKFGAVYILNSEYMAMGSNWTKEGAHLTDYSEVAYNLVNGIITGSFDAAFHFTGTMKNLADASVGSCNIFINNSTSLMYTPYMAFDVRRDGQGITVGYNTWTELGTWGYPKIVGGFDGWAVGLASIGGTWKSVHMQLQLNEEGKIRARVVSPEGLTVSGVEAVNIMAGVMVKDTML